MVFKVPKELDEFLTLGFLILFVLSFMLNVYRSSEITLEYYDYCFDIVPEKEFKIDTVRGLTIEDYMKEYANISLRNSKYAMNVMILLYWVCIPILCFYYSMFKFKKEMWKEEKTENYLNNEILK